MKMSHWYWNGITPEPLYTGEPYPAGKRFFLSFIFSPEIVNGDGGAPDSIYYIIELCKVFRITPYWLMPVDNLYFFRCSINDSIFMQLNDGYEDFLLS